MNPFKDRTTKAFEDLDDIVSEFTEKLVRHRTERVGHLSVTAPTRVAHGGWASTVRFTDDEGRTTSFNMADPSVSAWVATAASQDIEGVFRALLTLAEGQSPSAERMAVALEITAASLKAAASPAA